MLNNITNAYQLGANQADSSHIERYVSSTSLLQFINDETVMHASLIWFYKSILDFKQIDIEDQVLLIKCNLLNIIHLHHIIVQNFQDNQTIGKHMKKWIDEEFHEQMSKTRRSLYYFMKYPLLLKLALVILIFSTNLSLPRGSSQYDEYKNPGKIFELQNFYTDLLWHYLLDIFEEKEAIHAFQIIIMQILRYQKLMIIMESHVRQGPHMNILHSLMQSIFGFT